jgi:hypothetical protein
MKKRFYTFALILFGFILHGQKEYKGKVINAETGEPIPFVNIGIIEKGIGTVSDEEGLFYLSLEKNEVEETSKVLFSALGFKSLNIQISKIPLGYDKYPIFKMEPSNIELNEVVVSNKQGRFITDVIGYKNYGEKSFGYWKDQVALGGELATKIYAKTGLRRLEKFQFEVFDNPSDSLLLRVNIYDDDGVQGLPKTNLNTSNNNILITVKRDDKIVWVDLKPYDIYTQDDFIVSLELLKVYGEKKLGLILMAAFNQFGSYRKYASQDKWELITQQNMAYSLETSFMVSEKMAQRFEKKEVRKKQKERTISGFTLNKGRMISGVEVINNRTNEQVFTDEKGRYTIAAKKKDRVVFKKSGFKTIWLTVDNELTKNIVLKSN